MDGKPFGGDPMKFDPTRPYTLETKLSRGEYLHVHDATKYNGTTADVRDAYITWGVTPNDAHTSKLTQSHKQLDPITQERTCTFSAVG